eukprot:TRINITY_DN12450_c0_g1_i1.p1 TRINITY_DN12450_c0_g1~~TRINITY_DN12450_c0_g1_i1.p1  ORF type:complete len:162 (+),score=17.12 TRINITY_DN12450_c0_g1_i1:335-820(+)
MIRRTLHVLGGGDAVVTSLRVKKGRKHLEVGFANGDTYQYLAEYLRTQTTSADAVGHSESQKKLVFGKKNVTIENIWQVGNYAVTIEFSDGHKTGIYGWDYLHDLGVNKYSRMRAYIKQLRAEKKFRVPQAASKPYPSILSKVKDKMRKSPGEVPSGPLAS